MGRKSASATQVREGGRGICQGEYPRGSGNKQPAQQRLVDKAKSKCLALFAVVTLRCACNSSIFPSPPLTLSPPDPSPVGRPTLHFVVLTHTPLLR